MRLRRELEEETTARLVSWRYLFVVENFFVDGLHPNHALEHYVLATIDRVDVESRDGGLIQEWLALGGIGSADLRPYAVRDLLPLGKHELTRHLVVRGWSDQQPGR
jgi:8-oxo-dGTP pyrophosphatase MutT (NUDIX family)